METVKRKGDWFQTYTGRRFYILDPRPEDICIEDIAHSLACTSRYGGHGRRPLSVAEHCCLLAELAGQDRFTYWGEDRAWQALMHDAGEAIYGDIKRPIKNSIPAIGRATEAIDRMIAKKFSLTWPQPSWLHEIDARVVHDEKLANMAPTVDGVRWHHEDNYVPLGVEIQCLPWQETEEWFLQLYHALKPAELEVVI